MTGKQFKQAFERLQLGQSNGANTVGRAPRTIRRYMEDPEIEIPESVAILVRLMVIGKVTPADLQALCQPQT